MKGRYDLRSGHLQALKLLQKCIAVTPEAAECLTRCASRSSSSPAGGWVVPIGMNDTYMEWSVMKVTYNQRNEPSKPCFEQLSSALSGSSGYDSCETDCPHSYWHSKITFCANYLFLPEPAGLFVPSV